MMTWSYPNLVAFYSPPMPDADPYDAAAGGWALVATNQPANVQPLTGDLRQMAAGMEIQASQKVFVPNAAAVAEGFGVAVLAGPGMSRRLVVQHVGEQGPDWDTELLCSETPGEF